MFDIIGKRFWYFTISGVVILAGVIAMFAFPLQNHLGIQFKSGTEVTIRFVKPVEKQALIQTLADLGYPTADVRAAGTDYLIDLPVTMPIFNDAAKNALTTGLTAKLGEFQDGGFEQVSAKESTALFRNTIIAVLISALTMLIYISWAFRKVPNPFRWGVCAIVALVHDLVVAVGVFALFVGLFGWQVDLLFIAAVLTVVGYSVNDTIVIFDRIRENLRNYGSADFEGVVNRSLVETMARTLNTGLTVLFTLIALWLVVGAPIQNLVAIMLVGIITGTYSSIGTASSLLVVWRNGEWGRFIGRKPALATATGGK